MIGLLALTISGILLAQSGSSVTTTTQTSAEIQQEKQEIEARKRRAAEVFEKERQERESKEKRAEELLENASFVELEFTGNRNFSSQELLEQMQFSPDPNRPGQMVLATPAYLHRLQNDLGWLRFFLGTKGYLQAKIGEPEVKDLGDRIKVTVEITEGTRYRIGQIIVKDAKVFSPQEIIKMSGLVRGAWIDANVIQEKFFRNVKEAYADQGYIQASVAFIPDFKAPYPSAAEGTVGITLEIDEGRKFFVEWIDFYGEFSEKVKSNKEALLDCMLLKEGDIYSRQLMNETLKNLNQLGWFEELREKDVVTRMSDGEPQLQIKIRAKEIKSSPQQ